MSTEMHLHYNTPYDWEQEVSDLGISNGIEYTVKELLDLLEEERWCMTGQLFQHQNLKPQHNTHKSRPTIFSQNGTGKFLVLFNSNISKLSYVLTCILTVPAN